MNRIASLTASILATLAFVLVGAFLTASPAGEVPADTDSRAVPVAPEYGAVPASDGGGADAPSSAVPASDGGAVTVPEASGDDFDPAADALPADAPRVCVILDMGAAACESFVHPAPGEVSVAVIYSDDDERAIVETIAYDEHGPIDYVDFWEGETTPSE